MYKSKLKTTFTAEDGNVQLGIEVDFITDLVTFDQGGDIVSFPADALEEIRDYLFDAKRARTSWREDNIEEEEEDEEED